MGISFSIRSKNDLIVGMTRGGAWMRGDGRRGNTRVMVYILPCRREQSWVRNPVSRHLSAFVPHEQVPAIQNSG